MTDKERYKELLTETGVYFEEGDDFYPNGLIIYSKAGPEHKNSGYTYFYNVLDFDEEGNLKEFGLWE